MKIANEFLFTIVTIEIYLKNSLTIYLFLIFDLNLKINEISNINLTFLVNFS